MVRSKGLVFIQFERQRLLIAGEIRGVPALAVSSYLSRAPRQSMPPFLKRMVAGSHRCRTVLARTTALADIFCCGGRAARVLARTHLKNDCCLALPAQQV